MYITLSRITLHLNFLFFQIWREIRGHFFFSLFSHCREGSSYIGKSLAAAQSVSFTDMEPHTSVPQSRVGLEFYRCGSSGHYSLKWEINRTVKTVCCCHCLCYFHAVRNNSQLLKIHKRTESNSEVHLGDLFIEAV